MKKETKSFFGKVIAGLISIFIAKYKDFIALLWKKVPKSLQPEIIAILSIVELIKSYVDGPDTDLIKTVVPGDEDSENGEHIIWLRGIVQDVITENNPTCKPGAQLTRGECITIGAELINKITGMPWGQSVITAQNCYDNEFGVNKKKK